MPVVMYFCSMSENTMTGRLRRTDIAASRFWGGEKASFCLRKQGERGNLAQSKNEIREDELVP